MRARVAASAGLTALVALALTGCNFFTPQSTLVPYDPSDGVSAQVGEVALLQLGGDAQLVVRLPRAQADARMRRSRHGDRAVQ